jgi:hypothetical protein
MSELKITQPDVNKMHHIFSNPYNGFCKEMPRTVPITEEQRSKFKRFSASETTLEAMTRGVVLFQQHQDVAAVEIFKQILIEDPQSIDAIVFFSEFLIDLLIDYEEGTRLLHEANIVEPDRADVHKLFACVCSLKNDDVGYEYHLRKTIELEPSWTLPRLSLIELLVRRQKFNDAINELQIIYSYINDNFALPDDELTKYYECYITGRSCSNMMRYFLEGLKKQIVDALEQDGLEK